MKHLETVIGLLLVAAGIAVPPTVMAWQMRHLRHFAVVKPGVLYRSGQPTLAGLKRIRHDHRIRTIVSLRSESASTRAEEEWCGKNEVKYVRLDPRNWDGVPGAARIDAPMRRFLDVMKDPGNHPVLVHCFAGNHRTGGYVAVWRMEAEGWSNEDAMSELRDMGYDTIDGDLDISAYLRAYVPGTLGTRTAQGQ